MNFIENMNKKNKTKEIADTLYAGIRPIIDAGIVDKRRREEKILFDYFRRKLTDGTVRVKNVSIVDDLFKTKIIVECYSSENGFFSEKYNYDELITEINAQKEEDGRAFGRVCDHYYDFIFKFADVVGNCRAMTLDDTNFYEKIIITFSETYQRLTKLDKIEIYTTKDYEDLEEFDRIVKTLAKEVGIELINDEPLMEGSFRKITSKGCSTSKELKFMREATNYLKDKSKENEPLKEYKKFAKLSRDEKIRITYYEVLLEKFMEYQFDLVKKDSAGEMLNKLFVENSQKSKRREQQLIDKVLNDEELKESEYIDLAFIKIDYYDLDFDTLRKPYVLEKLNERLEALKKIINADAKHKRLYKKSLDLLECWKRLIDIFKESDSRTAVRYLDIFAREIFERHLDDVNKYFECFEKDEDEWDEEEENFDYYQHVKMLEKISAFLNTECGNNIPNKSTLEKEVKEYLGVIEKNKKLLDISKALKEATGDDFPKDCYGVKKAVAAYYDSYSEDIISPENSASDVTLRGIVDLQRKEFEQGMSKELIELIREDKLEVPRQYIRK